MMEVQIQLPGKGAPASPRKVLEETTTATYCCHAAGAETATTRGLA